MTEKLINKFVRDHNDTKNNNVREQYGRLAGVVGIISNIILFGLKLAIGFLLNSVAVMADSINNLSDSGSSIVTLIGFRIGNKPADEEHPFGHGRSEYVAALIVSFLIMLMGYEFFKTSFIKILEPEAVTFHLGSICILFVTVGVKIWLSGFNKKIGKLIDSKALTATADDARNDVIVTLITIVSIVVSTVTGFQIDGYAGVVVACVLIKNGFDIAKDTLSPLIGESTTPEIAEEIKSRIEKYEGIIGTHDLIVHNYGPNNSMATIHAEVPDYVNIEVSHGVIDRAEKEIAKDLGIYLVIHMDPVAIHDERITMLKNIVLDTIGSLDPQMEAHEFRIINGETQINFIFDLSVPHCYDKEKKRAVCKKIQKSIRDVDIRYHCIINVESGYVAKR